MYNFKSWFFIGRSNWFLTLQHFSYGKLNQVLLKKLDNVLVETTTYEPQSEFDTLPTIHNFNQQFFFPKHRDLIKPTIKPAKDFCKQSSMRT